MSFHKLSRLRAALFDLLGLQILIIPGVLIISVSNQSPILETLGGVIYYIVFGCFIAKDVFKGGSLFKMNDGIKIVDNVSLEEPSPLRKVLRNSTLFVLMPIEILACLFSPQRRVGDYIVNTKIISTNPVGIAERVRLFNWRTEIDKEVVIALILAQIIAIASFGFIGALIPSM